MKYILTVFLFAACGVFNMSVFAQDSQALEVPDQNPYLDQGFQDFVETVYGYKNPDNSGKFAGDYRDSLTSLISTQAVSAGQFQLATAAEKFLPSVSSVMTSSGEIPGQYYKVTFANEAGPLSAYVNSLDASSPSGFKAWNYAFISLALKSEDYSELLSELTDDGFKFAGEKNTVAGANRKTVLIGWAPYAMLDRIAANPQVSRLSIEKRSAGVPVKTKVRFTLRAPGGANSAAFVSEYIRRLALSSGFNSETIFRLPNNSGSAKFTAFEITGIIPLEKVAALAGSSFITAVEFKDKSL